MNRKFFLYAATVAVSLASSLAMADEVGATRTQVVAEFNVARADGTLQRTDYDAERVLPNAGSAITRDQVVADAAAARASRKALTGSNANRIYNPFGTEILQASTLARDEVRAETRQAAAAGTLRRSDYDDVATAARRSNAQAAASRLAQRSRTNASGG